MWLLGGVEDGCQQSADLAKVGVPVKGATGRDPQAPPAGSRLHPVETKQEIREFLTSRRGRITPEQVSFGKLYNIREAIKIARECRTIMGAAGITLEWPMMRHANNLESVLTYEGTSEVHQLVIGKALTGQDAFR